MRRLGAILMIVGTNVVVASLAAAYWRASLECALRATNGHCAEGVMKLFFGLLLSGGGVGHWLAIVAGVLIFWQGKRVRAR